MKRAVRTILLVAAVPLATAAAAGPVCPVRVHHAATAHKATVHRTAGIGLAVDQARLVAFPQPVKTVYVGNPTIVDISMIDTEHAFLQGKTFGVTNLIALSADGKQVSNQQVTVLNNGAAVTVNRGADQFNYMCTVSHCETAPRPGDPQAFVQNSEGAATQHTSAAATSAAAAASGQTASNQ
jgi:hypothetical protein